MPDFFERSLIVHEQLRGKLGIVSRIPIHSREDLAIAYTPGVARPCEVIAADPKRARDLTIKRNSVAVVSDGSAVLGLGNIGPEAAIPVMEGKAILFKEFAGIDAWPICLATQDAQEIIETVRRIAPVFGGINLEDISAPRCFEIESSLQDLGIPVFHDDQHGTAIVLLAALMNAAKVVGRELSEMRIVINGAGAAGTAIARLLRCVGHDPSVCVPVNDVIVCDTRGAIHSNRQDLTPEKRELLNYTNREHRSGSVHQILAGADVFIGVSKGNLLTAVDIRTMKAGAIVLAMANPIPEIMPDEARRGGALVIGTGRSDFPNQVNNVLVFPGIFRGALDSGSPRITEEMKVIAANTLAACVEAPTVDRILPDALDRTVAPRIAAAVARAAVCSLLIAAITPLLAQEPAFIEQVGRQPDESQVTPVNQQLTPFGIQVELPGLRPQALALSPSGQLLAISGKTSELVILDPQTGEIRQRVAFPNEEQNEPLPDVATENILEPDKKGLVSFTGLVFSTNGQQVYLSNVNGSIKVFNVDDAGQVTPARTIPLPPANAPRREQEIPSGMAFSEDGQRLYICGNLSNRLLELQISDGTILRTFDVGVAPYDVVRVGQKLYVSNWGGRRPREGDLTGPAGRGTEVRVDPVRYIASEGSVSVIDLDRGSLCELVTGRHASALAVSPDQRYVVCANAASDNLHLIDTAVDRVVETIWTKPKPSDLFGAGPNALAFAPSGKQLFVANGSQNAIAVLRFEPEDRGDSKLQGLIPVGWYPGAIVYDIHRKQLCVANIKGLPASPKKQKGTDAVGFNSHHYHGSVSLCPLVDTATLASLSERVAKNMRRESISQAALPPRPGVAPRPIPERIGEPSLIKHVVYVIKENRTYDQVLGDVAAGRGDASLCVFGANVTPNQHKLVSEFCLLDNTYCAGILSADGHQWCTSAMSTDYLEKSFAGFPRSYPDGMGEDEADALSYSPAGFLWDNAVLHNKSIRNYGEFMMPQVRWRDTARDGEPDFDACYRTWQGESDAVLFASTPSIESISAFSPMGYVGWEMSVPDQFRADFIINELKEYEARDEFPQLLIVCLPNDHTSGTKVGCPTPAACVADNDLAFGRIVDALSHSTFWPDMAIFAIEDDPQAGWDHVSGYRTTAFCISPYAKRQQTISTNYNTTSMLRTIEQILGLPPMNQFDASATPLFDCFTEIADLTPFDTVANHVPLDEMNPDPKAIKDEALREDAVVSGTLNFKEIDRAPEDVLNRILWRSQRGSVAAYPEWATMIVADDDDE